LPELLESGDHVLKWGSAKHIHIDDLLHGC
jgi:hypothetical protein